MTDGTHDSKAQRSRRQVAVALKWDPESPDAPTVTAKGEGALAEQILRVAFERGIKVRTDADLAEVLRASELDREIPYAAFAAVAEILAYLYQANGAAADPGPDPATVPAATDPAATDPATDEAPE